MTRRVFLSSGIWSFMNPLTGKPIAQAKVYIGASGTDPEIEANRVAVTVVQEDGTETAIAASAQPLRCGQAGQVMYNGSAVSVLIDVAVTDAYAVKVLDANDQQILYSPNVSDLGDDQFVVKTGDTMSGQLKQPLAPVAPEDLANKAFVEANVQGAYDLLYPVGALFFGADPSSIITGSTWALLAEGTFIMSTAGGDLAGGANTKVLTEAEMPSHSHGRGTQEINASVTNIVNNQGASAVGSGAFSVASKTVDSDGGESRGGFDLTFKASDGWTGTSEVKGQDTGFDNRPLYVGVAIYQRIS